MNTAYFEQLGFSPEGGPGEDHMSLPVSGGHVVVGCIGSDYYIQLWDLNDNGDFFCRFLLEDYSSEAMMFECMKTLINHWR